MANPNLLAATSMYAKLVTGATAGTAITCGSDKLIKIVSITLANATGAGQTDLEAHVNDREIWSSSSMADNTSAHGYSTIQGNINNRMPIYLQETHTLKFVNTGSCPWTVSYEEYNDA